MTDHDTQSAVLDPPEPAPAPAVSSAPVMSRGARETAAPAEDGEARIVDVWSRTEPKYRVRAIVLLGLNLLLYCGLCAFLHWLHVGVAFEFTLESYLAPAKFWDSAAPNLNDFILEPISVVEVPLHAVVLGLSLAVLAGVPIVVSILYRFQWALPFLGAVLVFAHMPWMAFTLCCSCILASVRPFRMSFRFGSALVALLPVVVYLFMATDGGADEFAAYGSPVERSLLVAPWVVTLLAAALMMGAALVLARLVNYRPGAVAPVVAVMVATPVTLFYQEVGVDELSYRVLERKYGPRSERFDPALSVAETEAVILDLISQAVLDKGYAGESRAVLRAVWGEDPQRFEHLKERIRRYFLMHFLRDRAVAYEAFKRFIADHPHSRYLPNVLFLQARVMDMRMDERRLTQSEPRRELYADFPHAQAGPLWLKLYRQYPDSPLAIAAALRLAQLDLRAGETAAALEKLEFIPAALERMEQRPNATQPNLQLLRPTDPMAKLDFDPAPYARDARVLAELVRHNRSDPVYGDAPLIELMKIDRRRGRYGDQLLWLAAKYPDSLLHDNLVVRWAESWPTLEARISKLHECLTVLGDGDALPSAYYRLGMLELQRGPGADEAARTRAREAFEAVCARFPDTVWAEWAQERLAILPPASGAQATP